MKVRPYRPCTAQDVAAASARAARHGSDWSAAWVDAAAVTVHVSAPVPGGMAADFDRDGPWWAATGECGTAWVNIAAATTVAEALFEEAGVGARRKDGLAAAVGRRALGELLCLLAGQGLANQAEPTEAAVPVHLFELGRAMLAHRVEFGGGGRVDIYLELPETSTAVTRRDALPLAAMSLGLNAQAVRVQAMLADTEIELGQLHGLAVGDVLRLDAQLDAGIELRIGDKRLPCKGYLGLSSGRLAVELGRIGNN